MLENNFDLYLESFSENYEIFTEGSIKDRLKTIRQAIIKFLKMLKDKIISLIDIAVSKFKKAFSKDDVLMKKVDETIKAEKSGNYEKPEAPSNKEEPKTSSSEPEKQKSIGAKKILYLTDDTFTVRYRRFKQLWVCNLIYAGMSPVDDDTIKAMRKHGICDDNYNLKVSVDELKKFMLNRKAYDIGTRIAYSTNSPEELIRSIFFIDDDYKEYSVKDLGGLKRIKDDYQWAKKCIPELQKAKTEFLNIINDIIKEIEEDNKEFEKDVAKTDENNDRVDIYKIIINKNNFQKQCLNVFSTMVTGYAVAALHCSEEAYKMSKAALIKCVGGASNFSESQINKIVLTAMYETDMCFV